MTPLPLPPYTALRRVWPLSELPAALQGPNLARTAHHEAGHAVLLDWAGIAMTGATATVRGGVVSIDFEQAKTDVGNDCIQDYDQPLAAAHLAACWHAGILAELLYTAHPWRGITVRMNSADWSTARMILAPHFGTGMAGHGFAQRTALAVLSERWADVERIAAELIEHGTWNPHAEYSPPE
ncbi:hypothetical protein [Pseudothauera lacus]|uniref:Uncharacterized protein n=1 Tax=Pseudothauera lacus TaxID=2136175 RepID=A0A2T4IF49_9RHOO|nr:hypothetical protein [Pseudothauera lacus]PTD96391.1 hypothetical protein C8261_08720 [Pseudothauera lacus]